METQKISNVIENLERLKKEFGDLPCIHSSDDEGNSFHNVIFTPTPMEKVDDCMYDSNEENPTHICIN